MHELRGLGVLQVDVLFLALWLHEILMDHFSDASPFIAVLHKQKVVTLCDEIPYVRDWTMAIYTALLIQQFLNHIGIGYDKGRVGKALERVYTAVLLRPLGESITVSWKR